MKNVIVLHEAADDIERARDFYEAQQPSLGRYCVASVVSDIISLAQFSGIHSRHFGFHRMLGTHFRFGIYYRIRGNDILVAAVLDLRRNPKWLRATLRGRTDR